MPLPEAVRRMTALPAETLGLHRRGRVAPGYFADLAVFDPGTIADHATYDRPHRYASGVAHVIVNGVPDVRDGRFSGRVAGQALRRGNARVGARTGRVRPQGSAESSSCTGLRLPAKNGISTRVCSLALAPRRWRMRSTIRCSSSASKASIHS